MSSLSHYKSANERLASAITIGGFRPTGNPAASHFGLPPLALPTEAWPTFEGRPLFFVCQLNLTEAPYVPPVLSDVEMLTLFIPPDDIPDKKSGVNWVIREYSSLEGLVPMEIPEGATVDRGFELKFDQVIDYPSFDDSERVSISGFDSSEVHLDGVHRSKIGGYATNIQSGQWWNDTINEDEQHLVEKYRPQFCLQIVNEEKVGLFWGDSGTLYFARSTTPDIERTWFYESQNW